MRSLRQFIREALGGQERVASSWLRRPKQRGMTRGPATVPYTPPLMSTPLASVDVADDLEQQRQGVYASMADDFSAGVEELTHKLEVASDIDGLLDAMEEYGEEPREIVHDPTDYDTAVEKGDTESVRRMILQGLGKWRDNKLRTSEQGDYDAHSLAGHPMRSVKGGGFSFKRPIRP